MAEQTDEAVVEAAADAARDVIFSRYDHDEIEDLDVRISFDGGVLDVDVFVEASGDERRVADDAALAARGAADALLREKEDQHGERDG